jgi:sugar-phosphatase
MALNATLFDMDGLLIDSEILWNKAEIEIFGSLGVPFETIDGRKTKGAYVDEVVKYWRSIYPWDGPSNAEVVQSLLTRVGELVRTEGRLLPGAERTIALCAERGPIALASSTPKPLILTLLDHFGLRDRFKSIHSADVEPFGKPHPGVFLSAAAALGVDPTECLVFEDSPAGTLAGKAGRMTVVAVPVEEDRSHPAIALADLILDSLEDLDPAWLDERFSSKLS